MRITKESAAARISTLRTEIEEHNRRYYIQNSPTVSDFEFDILMEELKYLESRFPDLLSTDSPTQKVGSDLSVTTTIPPTTTIKEFAQVKHSQPMLSLSNTYDKGELISFDERVKKTIGTSFKYVCELKIDGSAISLIYRDNTLIKAVTRGDGFEGDDVTENVITIKSIPKELKKENSIKDFEIRGEIFMSWTSFDRLNAQREANEEPLFANPRNAAAGSLKLLDSSEVKQRDLSAILYQVITDKQSNTHFTTHSSSLKWAEETGLPVSGNTKVCNNLSEVIEYLDYWDINRKNLDYPTDGVVIKIDEFENQNKLGITSKSPRWATAFKFKAERALTQLLSIDYQVGRTGAITPVANLAPVLLSGTTVKRASLHNSDQMSLMDIHINDYVFIEKGGEIIPKIVAADVSKRNPQAPRPVFPLKCPACGSDLYKFENESKHYCPNTTGCPPQITGRFLHFTGRKAMNILAGDATITQMYNLGYIKTLSDLYKVSKEMLIKMEGWKERAAERFLNSLEDSKKAPFNKVLFALGIRFVGEATAKALANHFGDIDSIMTATKDQLTEVEDVGDVVADSVINFFSQESVRKEIEKLKIAGLIFTLQQSSTSLKTNKLEGKTVVISGNFSVSRDDMKRIIEENSGKNSSSISKSTSYLVAGESAGPSKLDKAKKLGITVIGEDEFFNILKIID